MSTYVVVAVALVTRSGVRWLVVSWVSAISSNNGQQSSDNQKLWYNTTHSYIFEWRRVSQGLPSCLNRRWLDSWQTKLMLSFSLTGSFIGVANFVGLSASIRVDWKWKWIFLKFLFSMSHDYLKGSSRNSVFTAICSIWLNFSDVDVEMTTRFQFSFTLYI